MTGGRLEALFEQPHDSVLIDGLCEGLEAQADRGGLDSLTDAERVLLLVWRTCGIIGSDGLQGFFGAGIDVDEAAAALRSAGLERKAAALRKSGRLWRLWIPRWFEGSWDLLWEDFYRGRKEDEATLAGFVRDRKAEFQGGGLADHADDLREAGAPETNASPQRVAEWLMSIDTTLMVVDPAAPTGQRYARRPEDLPGRDLQIRELHLSGNRSTADHDLEGMRRLDALGSVRRVECQEAGVGPRGIEQLARWDCLEDLFLSSTSLRAEQLRPLSGLPRLRSLSLQRIRGPYAALEFLREIPTLRELTLLQMTLPARDARWLADLPLERLKTRRSSDDGVCPVPESFRLGEVGSAATGRGSAWTTRSASRWKAKDLDPTCAI